MKQAREANEISFEFVKPRKLVMAVVMFSQHECNWSKDDESTFKVASCADSSSVLAMYNARAMIPAIPSFAEARWC